MDPITAYIRILCEPQKRDPDQEKLRAGEREMIGLILRCCPPQQLEIESNRRLTLPVELSKVLADSDLTSP